MFVLIEVSGNQCRVLDTSDGVVDVFDKSTLLQYMQEYNLSILGINGVDFEPVGIDFQLCDFIPEDAIKYTFEVKTNTALSKVTKSYVLNKYRLFIKLNSHVVLCMERNNSIYLVTDLDFIFPVDLEEMFYRCYGLAEVSVQGFYTRHIRSMRCMFVGCDILKSVDLSGIDTSNVTNTRGMFSICHSIKEIIWGSFSTDNLVNTREMFSNCSSLKSLDLSSFVLPKANSMSYMFFRCKSLESVDFSNLDIRGRVEKQQLFGLCKNLKSIKISSSGYCALGVEILGRVANIEIIE